MVIKTKIAKRTITLSKKDKIAQKNAIEIKNLLDKCKVTLSRKPTKNKEGVIFEISINNNFVKLLKILISKRNKTTPCIWNNIRLTRYMIKIDFNKEIEKDDKERFWYLDKNNRQINVYILFAKKLIDTGKISFKTRNTKTIGNISNSLKKATNTMRTLITKYIKPKNNKTNNSKNGDFFNPLDWKI